MQTTSPKSLRWGLIGTGAIAKTFARAVNNSPFGTLAAVGSRSQESADKFADEFSVPHRHATYEDLLADPEVDAVYISTPHPLHAEWAIKTAQAKKHVLCEKPLGMNAPEAMVIAEACAKHGVILMEAFMYRCHPQTAKVVEIIRSGVLGQIKTIEASFGFKVDYNPESRLFKRELGGGGILDVGCYAVSMSRLIAGTVLGRDFAEPRQVKALGRLGESGGDEWTAAILKFDGDIIAQVATAVRCNLDNTVRVHGENGWLQVLSPWFCAPTDGDVKILLNTNGKTEEIIVPTNQGLYEYEVEAFANAVENGKVQSPAMSAEDAIGNARALDWWRREIGLSYDADDVQSWAKPLSGATVQVQQKAPMKYLPVPGLDKKCSQLVLGTMFEGAVNRAVHAFAMLDAWVEQGGNALDTARIYGSEKLVGNWLEARGVRDDLVIIGKGAHTPGCNPENLTRELEISLNELQTDYVDIYMMHRDNLDIPVGEFVEVLNEHQRAGRIKSFGGSNWSLERVAEANRYAQEHSLNGFTAVSNNFSLARLVEPMWAGCISSSDAQSRDWFKAHQLALFSWSSQARGFFVRGDRDYTADRELVRCWYADDNFERLERVQVLAERKNVSPINIAAAYVLHQPFPIFALIGPHNLSEIRTSLPALEVELSDEERAWLNLED